MRHVANETSITVDSLGQCGSYDLDVRDDKYKQSQVRGGFVA